MAIFVSPLRNYLRLGLKEKTGEGRVATYTREEGFIEIMS